MEQRARPTHCDACGAPPRRGVIHWDADSLSGAFRGWICTECRTILEAADNIPRLNIMISYLKRGGGPHET